MDDIEFSIVVKKSIKGVLALISRTILINILGIIASFTLSIYLDRSAFGVFLIVSALIIFLTYFQDIGLAGSLIQKKDEPTTEELRATFTFQQILVLSLIIPAYIFSEKIEVFYNLHENGLLLFNVFLLAFFLSSLKTIPTILLERRLNFHKLVVPQVLEELTYNVALIIAAVKGYGVTSFTIAVFLRSIVGLIAIYVIQPWPIGISFNFTVLKSLLSYGVPYQANSILALIKDNLINLYIGKVLPLPEVGYIAFAQKWAFIPLRIIMDNVIKVTFPTYSRLQHNAYGLKIVIEKSLFLISFFIFPVVAVSILYMGDFLRYVPVTNYYQKWSPALLPFMYYSLNVLFACVTVPLTNMLNAIGKVRLTLYFMVFWTALTWILTPLCIYLFGYPGVAIASAIVAASGLLALFVVKRHMSFSFIDPIIKPFFATILLAAGIIVTKGIISSLPSLLFHMVLAGCFYLGIFYLLAKHDLVAMLGYIRRNLHDK